MRIRFGNLTMTNHPIHMHGYDFKVTGTDGGWVDEKSSWPEVTVDVAVGQMRAFEFDAIYPGDWAIHCHKSHHTMNAMGHDVKTYIGVDKRDLVKSIGRLAPGYMAMGSTGMAEMGEMEMALPDNTLPMMTGFAQFGPVEMGGMFSVVKVREGLAKNDYKDPGWYKHPPGTVAFEYTGPKQALQRAGARAAKSERHSNQGRGPGRQAQGRPRQSLTTTGRQRTMKRHHLYAAATGFGIALIASLAAGPSGVLPDIAQAHGTFAAGDPGDPKKPIARTIEIIAREARR